MPRRPTERELLETLASVVESDNAAEELVPLLSEHGGLIASALGVTASQLTTMCKAPPLDRTVRFRVALRKHRERHEESLRRQAENLSIAAAEMLVGLSRWHEQHLALDAKIVLGGLLADRQRKYICFEVDGYAAVPVLRERLLRAKRALRPFEVECYIDGRGLNFRWRGGRGGLLLTAQNVDTVDAQTVLRVVFVRPQPKLVERQPLRLPTPPASSWLGDVLLDLAYL